MVSILGMLSQTTETLLLLLPVVRELLDIRPLIITETLHTDTQTDDNKAEDEINELFGPFKKHSSHTNFNF